MALLRRPKVEVDIRLPGITIGTDDLGGVFDGARSGPLLIISRACGMAPDMGGRVDDGSIAMVNPTNSGRRRLWSSARLAIPARSGSCPQTMAWR